MIYKISKMLTVCIRGGLGNQLFQIFAAIACAIQQGKAVRFVYSDISPSSAHRLTYWKSFLQRLLPMTQLEPLHFKRFNEVAEHRYTPFPEFKEDTELYGYFQSYKYFAAESKQICDLIGLEDLRRAVKAEYSDLFAGDKPTIAVHFRLGDYQHHIRLRAGYYERALGHFKDRQYKALYFCESNSLADAAALIAGLSEKCPNIEFVRVPDSIDDWKQMLIMSLCQNHVIANSTFSWWGAYFAPRGGRTVYPVRWGGFTPASSMEDLCLPEWMAEAE